MPHCIVIAVKNNPPLTFLQKILAKDKKMSNIAGRLKYALPSNVAKYLIVGKHFLTCYFKELLKNS